MAVVCVDFGSTFTKLTVVEPSNGALVATASSPTTIDSDVADGLDNARAQLRTLVPDIDTAQLLACSSAGGGLRLAVVGYERAITAEAGYRVGLSAGARVVHVTSGELDGDAVTELVQARPDVILLVGGTDGGNSEVLIANSRVLARCRVETPIVVAGNVEARDQVGGILRRAGIDTYPSTNVLPQIGVLEPRAAREHIREVFIEHVIGGKHLSERLDLPQLVSAATPDAVLAGVEMLSDGFEDLPGVGDVVVVDIGGATTDVYSVVTPDAEQMGLDNEAVSTLWRSRTVEGDLGVRWNATGIVDAAVSERLVDETELPSLRDAALIRTHDPSLLPIDEKEAAIDRRLATLAATVALRRHARPQTSGAVHYAGKDLRRVRLVVGSGGVLRHSTSEAAQVIVSQVAGDTAGGWRHPEHARFAVDEHYVLAAAGLLARADPRAAMLLLRANLMGDAGL